MASFLPIWTQVWTLQLSFAYWSASTELWKDRAGWQQLELEERILHKDEKKTMKYVAYITSATMKAKRIFVFNSKIKRHQEMIHVSFVHTTVKERKGEWKMSFNFLCFWIIFFFIAAISLTKELEMVTQKDCENENKKSNRNHTRLAITYVFV